VQATIAFAKGEKSVTLYGYSPSSPRITMVKGGVGSVVYNAMTGLFRIVVWPGSDGSAVITIDNPT